MDKERLAIINNPKASRKLKDRMLKLEAEEFVFNLGFMSWEVCCVQCHASNCKNNDSCIKCGVPLNHG